MKITKILFTLFISLCLILGSGSLLNAQDDDEEVVDQGQTKKTAKKDTKSKKKAKATEEEATEEEAPAKVDETMQNIQQFYGTDVDEQQAEFQKLSTKELKDRIRATVAEQTALQEKKGKISDSEFETASKELDKRLTDLKAALMIKAGESEVLKLENELSGAGKDEIQGEAEPGTSDEGVIIFDDATMVDLIGQDDDRAQSEFFSGLSQKDKKKKKKEKEETLSVAKIDGFEDSKIASWGQIEGMWIGSGPGAILKYELSDKEKFAGKRSLGIQYFITEDVYRNWCYIGKYFQNPINLKDANTLSFYVKTKGFGGTLEVALNDQDGNQYKYQAYYPMFNANKWMKVEVPLDNVGNFNKENVVSMGISITFGTKFGREGLSGMVNGRYMNISSLNYTPQIEMTPTTGYLYIDEISFSGASSSLSSGKAKLNVDGSVTARYLRVKGGEPGMINYGQAQFSYFSDKFKLSTSVIVPITTVVEYDYAGAYMAPLLESDAFTKYSSKRWGWGINRAVYLGGLEVEFNKFRPYVDRVKLGSHGYNHGYLAMSMVYSEKGIGISGKSFDTPYELHYYSFEGDGYGGSARFQRQKIFGIMDLNTAALYEDRRAKAEGSGTYPSKTYKSAYVGFLELETFLKPKKAELNKYKELRLQGGAYLTEENWFGKSGVYGYNREIMFSPINHKRYKGNAYRANAKGTVMLPAKIWISEEFEYRHIDKGYMGDSKDLWGLTYKYASYFVADPTKSRILLCENGYSLGSALNERYVKDERGIFLDTVVGFKFFDVSYLFDSTKNVSDSDVSKVQHRLMAKAAFKNFSFSANYRSIDWTKSYYAGDDRKFVNMEFSLRALLTDFTTLTVAFADYKTWYKGLVDEEWSLYTQAHDQVWFASLQAQLMDNLSFVIGWKQIIPVIADLTANAAALGNTTSDISESTENAQTLQNQNNASFLMFGFKFVF